MLPETIDPDRVHEKQARKPLTYWSYIEHEGFWYPKRSQRAMEAIYRLRRSTRLCNRTFNSLSEFDSYAKEQKKVLENMTWPCYLCGFVLKTSDSLLKHKGSKNCSDRARRREAEKRGEAYVVPSQKRAYCAICSTSFFRKYELNDHLKTQAHKDKAKCIEIPTACFCGKGKLDTAIKFRRHLKDSKKCHKKMNKTTEDQSKWLHLHTLFRCKFSTKGIIIPKPVEESRVMEI